MFQAVFWHMKRLFYCLRSPAHSQQFATIKEVTTSLRLLCWLFFLIRFMFSLIWAIISVSDLRWTETTLSTLPGRTSSIYLFIFSKIFHSSISTNQTCKKHRLRVAYSLVTIFFVHHLAIFVLLMKSSMTADYKAGYVCHTVGYFRERTY